MKQLLILVFLILCGCSPKPDTPLTKVVPQQTTTTIRFSVERVGVISDDLAYDNRRGIYIITDHATNTQYIGVSGIGISQLGSHLVGKVVVGDER